MWTFMLLLPRCNNVHVFKTSLQMYVNVCFDVWLEDLSWWNTMSLIRSLGNILATLNKRIVSKLCQYDITNWPWPFRDDPDLSLALKTNYSRGQETWFKRITHNTFEFWRINMLFTDVADSARTIAATQVKHCLICRHKYFPFFTI